MRRAHFALLPVLVFTACEEETTGPADGGPSSLTIEASDSVVAIADSLVLSAIARDGEGAVSTVPVEWSSSDTSTARVSPTGTLAGVAMGYVDVVARAGELADTLRVRVHDAGVGGGQVRVRFGTSPGATSLSGLLRFYDTMAGGPGDEAAVFAVNGAADTAFSVIFVDGPVDGRVSLAPWPLNGGAASGPVALVRFGSSAENIEYYVSIDSGWIDLGVVQPPAAGWRFGTAEGFLDAPLVRVAPNPGGPPILTGDTLLVHANVRVSYQRVLRGHAVVTLEDGPLTGTSVLSSVQASPDGHGGWFYAWDADFDGLGSGPGRWEMNQELRMVDPAVGTFAFPRFTGEQFDEPATWPPRFSSIFYRDDPRLALVVDGTVTITRYIAPTLEDFGEVEGVLDARFELWSDSVTPTGDTVQAHVVFAAAPFPLVGAPPTEQPPTPAPFASQDRPFGTEASRRLHRR